MSSGMTHYSAKDLLEKLEAKGLAQRETFAETVRHLQETPELPLYLRALVGIGAFIASIFFIAFLSISRLIDYQNEVGLIVWGLVFVGGAIVCQRMAGEGEELKHSFLIQSAFALMAVGKTLFVFGVAQFMDTGWGVSLGLLLISLATYFIFNLSIDRFLSSFAVLYSVLINILWGEDMSGVQEMLFYGFFLLQCLGCAFLLTSDKVKQVYMPLAYAFAFSICSTALMLAIKAKFSVLQEAAEIQILPLNALLAIGLILLIAWLAGGVKQLAKEPLVMASIGVVLLAAMSAPGILLAIGFMVLGYGKHDRILLVLGALLLPVYIYLYYYNLDVSLMEKSAVLVGSGAVLLAGRFYLGLKGWDKEAA